MNPVRILRRPEVESVTGLSRSSIYALMANNSFPSAVKLGQRSVGWRLSDITAWVESRVSTTRNLGVQ